jgi:hypothetical protein
MKKNNKRLFPAFKKYKVIVQSRNLKAIEYFLSQTKLAKNNKITLINGMYELVRIRNNVDYRAIEDYLHLINEDIWVYVYTVRMTYVYHNFQKIAYPMQSLFVYGELHNEGKVQSVEDIVWDIIKRIDYSKEIVDQLKLLKGSKLHKSIIDEVTKCFINQIENEPRYLDPFRIYEKETWGLLKKLEPIKNDLSPYKNISYISLLRVIKRLEID